MKGNDCGEMRGEQRANAIGVCESDTDTVRCRARFAPRREIGTSGRGVVAGTFTAGMLGSSLVIRPVIREALARRITASKCSGLARNYTSSSLFRQRSMPE